jgi:hypothetical protein
MIIPFMIVIVPFVMVAATVIFCSQRCWRDCDGAYKRGGQQRRIEETGNGCSHTLRRSNYDANHLLATCGERNEQNIKTIAPQSACRNSLVQECRHLG